MAALADWDSWEERNFPEDSGKQIPERLATVEPAWRAPHAGFHAHPIHDDRGTE